MHVLPDGFRAPRKNPTGGGNLKLIEQEGADIKKP